MPGRLKKERKKEFLGVFWEAIIVDSFLPFLFCESYTLSLQLGPVISSKRFAHSSSFALFSYWKLHMCYVSLLFGFGVFP